LIKVEYDIVIYLAKKW